MNSKSLIDATYTDEQLAKTQKSLDDIHISLPTHVSLEEDDRKGGFKLGDKTADFFEKCNFYSKQDPKYLPGFVVKEDLFNSADYAVKMMSIQRKMAPLLQEIEDQVTIAGMEALSIFLTYYHNVKDASDRGVPGAKAIYDDLKTRFPGRPKTIKKAK